MPPLPPTQPPLPPEPPPPMPALSQHPALRGLSRNYGHTKIVRSYQHDCFSPQHDVSQAQFQSPPDRRMVRSHRRPSSESSDSDPHWSSVDLDTRINFMLDSKPTITPTPVILNKSISSESDDQLARYRTIERVKKDRKSMKKKHKHYHRRFSDSDSDAPPLPTEEPPPLPPEPESTTPFSRTPSPFLSREEYLKWHQLGIEKLTKAKEQEEQEAAEMILKSVEFAMQNSLTSESIAADVRKEIDRKIQKGGLHGIGGELSANSFSDSDSNDDLKCSDSVDEMSLSSLSSGEQKIETDSEHVPPPPPLPPLPPLPPTPAYPPYPPHHIPINNQFTMPPPQLGPGAYHHPPDLHPSYYSLQTEESKEDPTEMLIR